MAKKELQCNHEVTAKVVKAAQRIAYTAIERAPEGEEPSAETREVHVPAYPEAAHHEEAA